MGQVALVSGSSRGIGLAIAKKLAMEHFHVYLNGRNAVDVERAIREISANGGRADGIVSDLTIQERIEEAVQLVIRKSGRLDLIVPNLGNGRSMPGYQIEVPEFQRLFNINFFPTVALCNASIPSLPRGGRIIMIASIAGCEPIVDAPIAYSVAKTAVIAYGKNLARKLAEKGILVNVISPGNTLFRGSTWETRLNLDPEGVKKYVASTVPLDGFAKPEDVAEAVLYLARASFVTGHNLVVDGGQIHALI